MTVTVERVDPWLARPGWGLRVDLTPPEVIDDRYLARLRRRLAIGLVALLLVVAGGYVLAAAHHGAEVSSQEREQATTTQLHTRAAAFRDITQMQIALTRLQTQIGTLMADDVHLDALTRSLTSSLPPQMTITNESVTITPAESVAAAVPGANPALPTAIGTVTLAGTGRALDDLATYVESLQAIPGVTDVVPTSNTKSDSGVSYSVTMSVTTDLLSHRFDVPAATP